MNLSLLIGVSVDGVVHKDFTVKSPTGRLRIALEDAPSHVPGHDVCAFKYTIASIGPLQGAHESVIRQLTLPDRDYIHAVLTDRLGKGNIPVRGRCDGCRKRLEDSILANAVQVEQSNAEIKWVNGAACVPLDFTFPSTGEVVKATIAVPTIATELKVAEAKAAGKQKSGDIYTDRLAGLLVDVGGRKFTSRDLSELPLEDFDALLDAANNVAVPHLDGEAILHCDECGTNTTVDVEFSEWLVPLARRRAAGVP